MVTYDVAAVTNVGPLEEVLVIIVLLAAVAVFDLSVVVGTAVVEEDFCPPVALFSLFDDVLEVFIVDDDG